MIEAGSNFRKYLWYSKWKLLCFQ